LWQGRFQSSYITSETYLFTLLRYIEQNPLKAGIVKKLGDYEYISYKHFISNSPSPCLLNSFIYDRFETKKEIAEFLNEVVDEESEQKTLQEIRSQKVEIKEEKDRVFKPLRDYFRKTQTKEQRDIQIYQAFKDGYSQGKIAKEVRISQPAVFKIIKKLKARN
jgi:Mor family transcriptional regulator